MHHRGSATGHHQVYLKLKYQLPSKTFPTRLRRTNKLLGNCQRPALMPRATVMNHRSLSKLHPKKNPSKTSTDDSKPSRPMLPDTDMLSTKADALFAKAQDASALRRCSTLRLKERRTAAKPALKLPQSATQRIVVCLDNIAAAACLRGKPFDSSQTVFLTFQALAKTHRKTEVRWIPGHTKIQGNEQADILAKTGCAQPEPADAVPTPAFLRKTARQRSKIAVQAWWDASAPDK
ncbi:reverse transcriptase domain protein [Metarhizium robertsii]|uniref:Reverse transcriptase domain protein n=1 Tax=Metarhizium robertsii TaxID=568076 RepID=A0A014PH79_9HYPO|nr:reverse transcriptase domain protein [Metarhizium robertsii]